MSYFTHVWNHLRKDLLKGEQPSAELFYQKRAVTP